MGIKELDVMYSAVKVLVERWCAHTLRQTKHRSIGGYNNRTFRPAHPGYGFPGAKPRP